MHSDVTEISQIQSSIKRQIFKPIFMSFPFLDALGIPQREEARQAARTFTDFIVKSVTEVFQVRGLKTSPNDSVVSNLNGNLSRDLLKAFESGQISELQFRNNLTITFVAGQENPELALLSTLYLLAKSPVSVKWSKCQQGNCAS
jgi:unspecific monooxygenase